MSKDNDYTNVLLEEMNGKFDLLLEMMKPMKQMQEDVFSLKTDVEEVKSDVKVVKAAVTDQTRQLTLHDTRITNLETA